MQANADFHSAILLSPPLDADGSPGAAALLRFWWRVAFVRHTKDTVSAPKQTLPSTSRPKQLMLQVQQRSTRCGSATSAPCVLPCLCIPSGDDAQVSWGVREAQSDAAGKTGGAAGRGKGWICVANAVDKGPCELPAWQTLWSTPVTLDAATAVLGAGSTGSAAVGSSLSQQLGWRAAQVQIPAPHALSMKAAFAEASAAASRKAAGGGEAAPEAASGGSRRVRFVLTLGFHSEDAIMTKTTSSGFAGVDAGGTLVELGPLVLLPAAAMPPVPTPHPTPIPPLTPTSDGAAADTETAGNDGSDAAAPGLDFPTGGHRGGGSTAGDDMHFPTAPPKKRGPRPASSRGWALVSRRQQRAACVEQE